MRGKVILVFLLLVSLSGYAQKFYIGWTFRPLVSINTVELKEQYVTSDFNWRVYEVMEPVQTYSNVSASVGPTFLLDLFRVNINASVLLSARNYQFEARRSIGQFEYEIDKSDLSEGLIEIPLMAGVTLFSSKQFKLYLEGGVNYNFILGQDEDEPLLSGGNIFINYLMDGKNYWDGVGGAGIRYKNMYLTLRNYIRTTPLNGGTAKSSFWTLNYLITLKSNKYSKHFINL